MSLHRADGWQLVGGPKCGEKAPAVSGPWPTYRIESEPPDRAFTGNESPFPSPRITTLTGIYRAESSADHRAGVLRWQGWT